MERARDAAEILAALTTGFLAEPVAGWAGIFSGGDPGAVERTRQALTYAPRGKGANKGLEAAGKLFEPIEKGKRWLGDKAFEATGSPALATLAYGGPDLALTRLGARPAITAAERAASKLPPGVLRSGLLADLEPNLAGTVLDPQVGSAMIPFGKKEAKQFVKWAKTENAPGKKWQGASLNMETGAGLKRTEPTPEGYMVARRGPMGGKFEDVAPNLDEVRVQEYVRKNREALDRPGAYLGTWPQDGNWYLDVSEHLPARKAAADATVSRGEQAAYRAPPSGKAALISEPFPKFPVERNVLAGLMSPKEAPAAVVRRPSVVRNKPKPADMVAQAEGMVAPESPLLRELFGVTRNDLDELTLQTQHGTPPMSVYDVKRPPAYLDDVLTRGNRDWTRETLQRAAGSDKLAGSYGWYHVDPLVKRYIELLGPDRGIAKYKLDNQFGAALSPMSAVEPEITRSSIASMLREQGRLPEFFDPKNLPPGAGHIAHTSAHSPALERWMKTGSVFSPDLDDAVKTRVYYESRLPSSEANFAWPTGDAHWVRSLGLDQVRPWKPNKAGILVPNRASVKATEYGPSAEWFSNIAESEGMMGSPAQALMWNAAAPFTGVKTAIGAPYLELVAKKAGKAAKRQGVTPRTALDRHILGEDYLGRIDPELAALLGGSGLLALGGSKLFGE